MLMDLANARGGTGGEGYLTKVELAKRLKRTPRTIEHWMRRGYLPYKKVGRSVLFDWEEVQRHFNERYTISPMGERLPLGPGRKRPKNPMGNTPLGGGVPS